MTMRHYSLAMSSYDGVHGGGDGVDGEEDRAKRFRLGAPDTLLSRVANRAPSQVTFPLDQKLGASAS
jgi:hypothetical protein